MFALFPVFGVTQGFLPIAGFNYGAKKYQRVRESINTAILYAAGLAFVVFIGLMIFPAEIAALFLSNQPGMSANELAMNAYVLEHTPSAMRLVFAATPIIAVQLIGAAYFQAIGKAVPALLLTLSQTRLLFYTAHFNFAKLLGRTWGFGYLFLFQMSWLPLVTGYFLRKEVRATLVEKL